jgi:hypothetical protein
MQYLALCDELEDDFEEIITSFIMISRAILWNKAAHRF